MGAGRGSHSMPNFMYLAFKIAKVCAFKQMSIYIPVLPFYIAEVY